MEARKYVNYLERLCRDLDQGRRPSRFDLSRILAPVAVPAALALTLGVAGCDSDDTPSDEEEPVVEICDDAIDNDEDGLVDCDDVDCSTSLACYAVPFEDCENEIDDDDDGDTDCADSDCVSAEPCGDREDTFMACSDVIDNDGDGFVDCEDSDCFEICYAAPFL